MVRFLRTVVPACVIASAYSRVSVAAIEVLPFVPAHHLPAEPEGDGRYHVPVEDEGDVTRRPHLLFPFLRRRHVDASSCWWNKFAQAIGIVLVLISCIFMLKLWHDRNNSNKIQVVTLVFPKAFTGLAMVCEGENNSTDKNHSHIVINFDKNGTAISGKSKYLFDWSRLDAYTEDGIRLPIWDVNGVVSATDGTSGVWSSGSFADSSCIYFYVGTRQDNDAAETAILRSEFGPKGDRLKRKK